MLLNGKVGNAFLRDVYRTTKGDVRLFVVWEDMIEHVRELNEPPLRVIDIGAGDGRIAKHVGDLGHKVTLCEPSSDMLARARQTCVGLQNARFVQASAQDLPQLGMGTFDLVVCHALLEWVAQPQVVLETVLGLLEPQRTLSLMFLNRNAAILERVLGGDFSASAEVALANPRSAQALDPRVVQSWLEAAGLYVESKAGVRIFHDHLMNRVTSRAELDRLLRVEAALRNREPFASLGHHAHFVCKRNA